MVQTQIIHRYTEHGVVRARYRRAQAAEDAASIELEVAHQHLMAAIYGLDMLDDSQGPVKLQYRLQRAEKLIAQRRAAERRAQRAYNRAVRATNEAARVWQARRRGQASEEWYVLPVAGV